MSRLQMGRSRVIGEFKKRHELTVGRDGTDVDIYQSWPPYLWKYRHPPFLMNGFPFALIFMIYVNLTFVTLTVAKSGSAAGSISNAISCSIVRHRGSRAQHSVVVARETTDFFDMINSPTTFSQDMMMTRSLTAHGVTPISLGMWRRCMHLCRGITSELARCLGVAIKYICGGTSILSTRCKCTFARNTISKQDLTLPIFSLREVTTTNRVKSFAPSAPPA